ncbi:MAG: GNAT family N-acetyltransferase [Minisyncoccales bacterium]
MIRRAETKDIKSIMIITEKVNINSVPDKEGGFLMSKMPFEFYEKIFVDSDYCYVCEIDGRVVGFLIAYLNKEMKGKDELESYLLNNYSEEVFVYIFQSAVDPEYQRKNVGSDLYNKLFEDSKVKNFKVITAKEPFNKASRIFHQKLGFKELAIFRWDNGIKSYLYEKIA